MRRAWRVMSAIGVLLAAASILLTVVLFVHVQDLREGRVEDQALTFTAICERQELVATRTIDQKQRTIGIAKRNIAAEKDTIQEARILRRLINGEAPSASPRSRLRLRSAARRLSGQVTRRLSRVRRHHKAIARMREGIEVLQDELRRLDCDDLPAGEPFNP